MSLKPRKFLDSEIISVDREFRVKLPEAACKSADIKAGTKLLVTVDRSTGEIIMNVFLSLGLN